MSQSNSSLILDNDENAGNEYNQKLKTEENIIYYVVDDEGIKYYKAIEIVKESTQQNVLTSNCRKEPQQNFFVKEEPINDSMCTICFKQFSSPIKLEIHIKTKHNSKKYICDQCGKTFSHKNNIRLHMYHHRKYFEVECHACGKKYKTIQSLRYHLRQHFEFYSCEICDQEFKHKKLFVAHHASAHNQELLLKCNFCARKFARIDMRIAHERSVHHLNGNYQSAQFDCKEKSCEKSFAYHSELLNHMILCHYKGDIYSCLECGKKFKKKSLLNQHMNIHNNNLMRYPCEVCNQTFAYRTGLEKHIKKNSCKNTPKLKSTYSKLSKNQMREIAKKQLFEITVSTSPIVENLKHQVIEKEILEANMFLDYNFNDGTEYYKEIDSHMQIKFTCDICNESFKKKIILSQHIKNSHLRTNCDNDFNTHEIATSLFKCLECDKQFKRRCDMVNHQKNIHARVKIYTTCEQCGKTILEKSLKSHIINQHSEKAYYKPFICDYCGKRERYEKNLLRHVNSVHIPQSRGISYSCLECPETFVRLRDLRAHSFQHYSGNIFPCNVCNKKFKRKHDLRTHMFVHNKSQVPIQCAKCERIFQTKSGLYRHLRNHE